MIRPTHEIVHLRYTDQPLLELYGTLLVAEFELRRLKILRERLISSGLARSTVNIRVGRVIGVFGWGAEEEFVPPPSIRSTRPKSSGATAASSRTPGKARKEQAATETGNGADTDDATLVPPSAEPEPVKTPTQEGKTAEASSEEGADDTPGAPKPPAAGFF